VLARLPAAVAVCWLAFVALNTLLAGRFWGWLVFAPVPPLAFLVVPVLLYLPLTVPLPRRGTGVTALVAALLLGLPAAGLNVAALTRQLAPVPAGAIRVVAWNTEYWDTGDDPRKFTGYLVGMHADVYLLQEYLGRAGAAIDDRARLARDFPGYTVIVKHELVVLSRLPVLGTPPVDANSVLRVDVRVGADRLSLYDVHVPIQADYSRSPLSWSFYRAVHAKDADRRFLYHALEDSVRANPLPLLVAGDFNTTPSMGDLDPLRGMTEDAARASRQFYPRSWHAGPLHLWRLDWTLTAGGVQVHRYDLRDPAGMSDHDAQISEITLPARR
jgi:endonuclease/exonuclease/phosphatase (EEP) superfamily protein YafD